MSSHDDGNPSGVTREYTAIHTALTITGRIAHVHAADIRLLVAIADRGGHARTDVLVHDLRCEGSAVRRSLAQLYRQHLAQGRPVDDEMAAVPKPGVQTVASLTIRGHKAVRIFKHHRHRLVVEARQADQAVAAGVAA